MSIETTYRQYGVPSDWAKLFNEKQLSATTFKNSPSRALIEKYGINEEQVSIVKMCLSRQPIEENTLQQLLERNRYVCCLCKGQKSDAFIIHHIEPYSKTQDNSYDNLAVLCPNDHELVHREGQNLSHRITKEQILKTKKNWEREVEILNVQIASQNGEINEVDYINIPRVIELYYEVFHSIPTSKYSIGLNSKNILDPHGRLNYELLNQLHSNTFTPFISIGPYVSWELSLHFEDVFKQILTKVDFVDLDSLLNKKSLSTQELTGKFCFYVGGLYGNSPKRPIRKNSECCHLYFHRKSFFVEWVVDPQYMKSNSSIDRLCSKTEYLIYGRIRSIGIKEWKGKNYIYYNVRPYLFGLPLKTKSRKPAIHYIEKYQDFDFEEDE